METTHKRSAPERLAQLAETAGDHPALITPGGTFSYRHYHRLVLATSEHLLACGIAPGERVGMLLPNSWQYLALLLAMWRTGIVAVPISTRFPSAQITALLDDISVKKLIIESPQSAPEFSIFTEIDVHKIVPASVPSPRSDAAHFRPKAIDPQRDATVLFTSGSAGQPKAVVHSLQNHDLSAIGANQNMPFGPGDCWLLSLPLYHVGGLGILFRALHGGGAVAVPGASDDMASSLTRQPVTHVSLVATQLFRLLKNAPAEQTSLTHSATPTHRVIQEESILHSNRIGKKTHSPSITPLKKLKAVLLGGSAIPQSLIIEATRHNIPIFTTYGSTEMASQVTTTAPDDPPEKLFTSGRLLAHRQLRIANDGEMWLRGGTRFKGYLTNTGLQQPFDRDGWFASGDLGTIDADGTLRVIGRKDNMFISGGENIHPEEIEQALCTIDGVLQAVVVPVADAEFGQRPVAFVQLQANMQLDSKRIQRCLAAKIARFKIPKRLLPWPENDGGADLKTDRAAFAKLAQSTIRDSE